MNYWCGSSSTGHIKIATEAYYEGDLEAIYEALLREKQIEEIESRWLNYLQELDSEIQGQEDDLMASVFAGEDGLMELTARCSDERARIHVRRASKEKCKTRT